MGLRQCRTPKQQTVTAPHKQKVCPSSNHHTIVAAPLGHTHIHLSFNRLYRANLRLGCTPRLIADKTIHIICRLDHARIRHIHRVRLHYSRIIRWNKPHINLGLFARLAGHKRRITKRGSNRQDSSNRCCYQRRFPRQTAKRLRSIRDTRRHPKHSNKRLNKSFQGTLKQAQPKLFTHNKPPSLFQTVNSRLKPTDAAATLQHVIPDTPQGILSTPQLPRHRILHPRQGINTFTQIAILYLYHTNIMVQLIHRTSKLSRQLFNLIMQGFHISHS